MLLGNGFTVLLSLAAGLGALLALDRGDLRGDVCACLLLCLGLATYSDALPFVAGAAVLILTAERPLAPGLGVPRPRSCSTRPGSSGRGTRPRSTGNSAHLSNLLLAPNWALNSLATVGSSLLGLN